ncbi:MAG: hypothetical protein R8F63_08500 [Acidimicrobiales bacterium]|nr:hypothetical protein [Acidimicrobiales bacterium]
MQRGRPKSLVDGGQLGLDALLFLLHEFEWHGFGVVGLEQLGLLVEQLGFPAFLDVLLLFGCGLLQEHLVEDEVTKLVEQIGRRLNCLVVVLYLLLDGLDQNGTL